MKLCSALLCLLAIALPAVAAGPVATPACDQPALVSPAAAPAVELPWLPAEPASVLPADPLAPILMAHPCCSSAQSQTCRTVCGGCGRGVCDDGGCECLCC